MKIKAGAFFVIKNLFWSSLFFLRFAVVLNLFAAVIAIIKPDYSVADIISAFLISLTIASAICLIVSAITRSWVWCVVSIVSVLLAVPTLNSYLGDFKNNPERHSQENTLSKFSILSANVHVRNTGYSTFVNQVKELDPLIVVVIETDAAWKDFLTESLSDVYPFKLISQRADAFGMCIYSKTAMIEPKQLFKGQGFPPSFEFGVSISDATGKSVVLRTIALHTLPPIGGRSVDYGNVRDLQIKVLGEYIMGEYLNSANDPVIVVGDFNAPPWSAALEPMSHLTDARKGRCLCNTWPNLLTKWQGESSTLDSINDGVISVLGTPIDYIFYRGQISLTNFQTIAVKGSDHKAVMGTFQTLP